MNSLYDAGEDIQKLKTSATKYSEKLDDMELNIEETMETLFTYDGLYNELNRTLNEADYKSNQINDLRADIVNWIDENKSLVEKAKESLNDAQNNFQVRVFKIL